MKEYKEYGSDFHYLIEDLQNINNEPLFEVHHFSLFFSGRSALYGILNNGIENHQWEKVMFPSYYCHEVVSFIKDLPIEIGYYQYNPFIIQKSFQIDDNSRVVVVNVDFFGLNKMDFSDLKETIIIEDLTHNILFFKSSDAHYCFGSLRKEIAIPVGGFCFSPRGFSLPYADANLKSDEIAAQKLAAMVLKREYLKGNIDDKILYRTLFESAEHSFSEDFTKSALPSLAKAILFSIDVEKMLKIKQNNIKAALCFLNSVKEIRVNFGNDGTAFGLILECASQSIRDNLKMYLVNKNVYPAILWPNQKNETDKLAQNKMLFLHMDCRYSITDIEKITNFIKDFFSNG